MAGALVRRPVDQTAAVECDRRSGKERIMTSSIQRARGASQEPDPHLTVDEFARELEADTVTLIDIREPDEVGRTGAIPARSRHHAACWSSGPTRPAPITARSSTPASRTLLYCASGGRPALAVQSQRSLGYTDVAHLDGGLKAWAEHRRPVTHHAPN